MIVCYIKYACKSLASDSGFNTANLYTAIPEGIYHDVF